MKNDNKMVRKEVMKEQFAVYVSLIFLTFLATLAVKAGLPSYGFPLLLLLAGTQVFFQLYYFMHLKENKNFFIPILLNGGFLIGFVIVLGISLTV